MLAKVPGRGKFRQTLLPLRAEVATSFDNWHLCFNDFVRSFYGLYDLYDSTVLFRGVGSPYPQVPVMSHMAKLLLIAQALTMEVLTGGAKELSCERERP